MSKLQLLSPSYFSHLFLGLLEHIVDYSISNSTHFLFTVSSQTDDDYKNIIYLLIGINNKKCHLKQQP